MSIYMFKVKTYGNNKSCNKTFYISWKRELKAKVLLSDYTVGVLNLVVSLHALHSVMLALTHTIGVSNNTLSLSLSSPSLTVRPAMAWQWWESTVLYLSTCDVCLHTELLCCAPIEGNLIDSEGVRVCVCVCVYQYHMAPCCPPLILLLVPFMTLTRSDAPLLTSSEHVCLYYLTLSWVKQRRHDSYCPLMTSKLSWNHIWSKSYG